MPDLETTYQATELAPIADALSAAATLTRKAFQDRAEKHGVEDAEAIRLMACHKTLIELREDTDKGRNIVEFTRKN